MLLLCISILDVLYFLCEHHAVSAHGQIDQLIKRELGIGKYVHHQPPRQTNS